MNPLDLLTDESKRKFQEIVIESMKGEKTIFSADYEIRKKNGQSFWGMFHAKVNCKAGIPDTVQVFVQDITERKKIEEKLRISEERFSKAFKESPVAVAISRLTDGLFTDVNGAYLQIFGFDHDEIIGKTSAQLDIFVHPNQRKEIICQLREKGEIHNQEIRFKTKSGKIITSISSLDIINIANEDFIISTILDISERNRAEEELHSILENIDRGFMSVNRNWIIVYVNARAADNIGRKSEELIGKNLWIEFPQLEGTNIAKLYRKAMVERVAVEIEEYGVITGRWNQEKAYPTVNGIAIAWADITERKKTEERLKENQERLETAQRVAHVGSWDYFIKTDEAAWSKELYHIFGIKPTAKAPNMQEYRKLIDPDCLNDLDLRMQKFFAEGKLSDIISFDYSIKTPNGSTRFLHTERLIREVDECGKAKRIMGIEQDISERKKIEQTLKENARLYRAVFDNSQDAFQLIEVIHDEKGSPIDERTLKINHAFELLTGIKEKEILGKSLREFVPNIESSWFDLHEKVLKTGECMHVEYFHEYENRYYDAFYFFYSENVVGLLYRDITERKKAEETLKRSEEQLRVEEQRLRLIYDNVPEVLYSLSVEPNSSFRFASINQAFLNATGLKENQVIGKRIEEVIPEPSLTMVLEKYNQAIKEKKTVGWEEVTVYPAGKKHGEVSIAPLFDSSGRCINLIGNVHDVTERKNMEKQLQDNERMVAIGQTAGMVGHDIRNPLQAIAGDLFLIDNDVASLPEGETKEGLQESVKCIQDNLLYIAKIVEDLQDYAKTLKPNFERVRIDKVIEDVMLLMRNVTSNHHVIIDVEAGFPEIVSDFSMLKRALTNLTQNAIQAMPDGGQLTLRANHKGARVFICIEDTGEGIPEEVKPKLFTPMVTTKSKGQGLGLAVVKRLIEALNGKVSFESVVGQGTKFIIELPAQS